MVRELKAQGREVEFFNINAADEDKRGEVMDHIQRRLTESGEKIRILMHSLAFGTLKPFLAAQGFHVAAVSSASRAGCCRPSRRTSLPSFGDTTTIC